MKKQLRKILLWMLKRMAKRRLLKFKGKIIGVTGSVGKTTTKDAIFAVLNSRFRVKRTKKSMNAEFGLPLTILDIDSGFSSAFKWSWLLMKAFFHSLAKDHADVFLFEFGVDKPGDMDYLMKIVKPRIVVMTNVHPVHIGEGQFENMNAIFEEKSKLIDSLKKDGVAILNLDNPYTSHLAQGKHDYRVVTFGKNKEADYVASNVKSGPEELSFLINHGDEKYEISAEILGENHVHALLPAVICGELMGMKTEEIAVALRRFRLPPGRMNIIPAMNEATIIDSSYNASPATMEAALKILKNFNDDRRRVAVLGNMNELGEKSDKLHEEVGEIVPGCADMLLTVGKGGEIIGKKQKENGIDEKNIFNFKTATDAAVFFKKKINKNDIILVKGSQNRVRLERFVKELMAHPEDAKDLLVRQEKPWGGIN